jgi:hypothetical protein
MGFVGEDWIYGSGQVAGSCELGTEPSISIKYEEFFD